MMMNPSTAAFSSSCHLDIDAGRLARRNERHREAPTVAVAAAAPLVAMPTEVSAIETAEGADAGVDGDDAGRGRRRTADRAATDETVTVRRVAAE